MFLWRLLSFHLVGQERETVFILPSQDASYIQVLLICPPLCENGHEGWLSITWLKPHQTPIGQVGERGGSVSLLSCAFPGLPKQGRQPAKTGNSKDRQSCLEISCQNRKYSNLPELLADPTEIRPQLPAVLCEHMYCVCVYIYLPI